MKRNYPIRNISQPAGQDTPMTAYDLAGPLCTNIDLLGRSAQLPRTDMGDIIAIGCAGAYGLTASPTNFISHPPPREILLAEDGARHTDITIDGTIASPIDWSTLRPPASA